MLHRGPVAGLGFRPKSGDFATVVCVRAKSLLSSPTLCDPRGL